MNPQSTPVMYSSMDPGGQFNFPQSQAQPQPQPEKGNWFTHLLPTIGGIGGGILGSLTDEFTGPLGTIGGSAAGGALGQQLENMFTGTSDSPVAAAGENALGAGVGGVLGKVGSMLAGKVIAPLAEKGATQLVAGQAPGVTRDLADYLVKGHGITDVSKAGRMADVLTGSAAGANADVDGTAILNKFVENTLRNQGPKGVQIADMIMSPTTARNAAMAESVAGESNSLQKFITNNSLSGTPQANAIRSRISGILNGVTTDVGGATDSMSALNAQREIAKLANDSYDNYISSGRDATMKNIFNTYSDISNELKSRLGLHNIPVADVDKEALAADIEKFGSGVDKGAAKSIADELRGAQGLTVGGVRNLESNWVQVKNALQQASDQANKNFGTSTAQLARSSLPIAGAVSGLGGPKSLLGGIGGLATASPMADKAGAAALNSIAKGARGKIAQKILPLATRASTVAAANLPNIADASQGTGTGGTMVPGSETMPGGQPSPFSDLMQELALAVPSSTGGGSAISTLGSIAPLLQRQAMGQAQLGGLSAQFGAAGGPQGLGGNGILDAILAKIPGTAQHAAAQQAEQLAATLGISPGMAPNFLQSPGVAGTQMSTLQSILNAAGGGPTSAIPAVPTQ